MICTSCGKEIPDGRQAIFGVDRGDGKLVFGWTCCHNPVGDVAVILGSSSCVLRWLSDHGEYCEAVAIVWDQHAPRRGEVIH